MGQKLYGTEGIGGLDAQTAPHLLNDSALQVAQNVDYSERGAAQSASGDSSLLVSSGGIVGLGTASVSGEVYYFYKEYDGGSTVKAYKVSDGTTAFVGAGYSGWSSDGLGVVQGDDVAILYDGTIQRFWDGTCLYGFSAPVATNQAVTDYDYLSVADADTATISNVSVSGSTVTVTASAFAMDDGDKVWITDVEGADGINGRLYEIDNETGTTFTITDSNAGDWGAYTSGGTVHIRACGLSGTYTYRATSQVTLPSGKTIEGSAKVIKWSDGENRRDEVTLTPTKRVTGYLAGYKTTDVFGWVAGSYTAGADLTVARNLYRNKDGDTAQAYLVGTADHADVYNDTVGLVLDQVADADLGAVWLPVSFDSHDAPNAFTCAAVHAQRLYAASGSNLYFSGLDGHNYFQPLDYLIIDQPITALASVGDYLAIFAENGGWLYDPFNVALKSMNIRLGVSSQDAVESFNGDTWFANDAGLFRLSALQFGGLSVDAMQATPESGPVDDLWVSAGGGDWSLASTHDTLYATCSKTTTSSTFVLHYGDGVKWSTRDSGNVVRAPMVSDRVNDTCVYRSGTNELYTVGTGSGLTMTIKSKLYKMLWSQATDLKADIGAGASFTATIDSNEGETAATSLSGGSGRTIQYAPISSARGLLMDVEFAGTGTLYGWVLRVDEGAGYAGTKTF